MKKAPQGWLVFTRKKVAGFHPQNDNDTQVVGLLLPVELAVDANSQKKGSVNHLS